MRHFLVCEGVNYLELTHTGIKGDSGPARESTRTCILRLETARQYNLIEFSETFLIFNVNKCTGKLGGSVG